ncbi:MAG: iron export ABC transporter permease subunit FetB [candidate division Zixibacteria bacterium]|nr:iron export ABC transporter permease subunit FetB [candidate division Zixibacteria bacterium]
MIDIGFLEVAIAICLMILAIILARWQRTGTEKELAIGTVRSFVQLVAVGYALEFIFGMENFFAIIGTMVVMMMVGAYTAGKRAVNIKNGSVISFIAIFTGSLVTLGLMLGLGIIKAKAQYMIPLGGMIIGNSMNCSALVMERLYSDISGNKLAIETSLSLGKSWQDASRTYFQRAIKAGMMHMLNFFKTVGLVALPGAMTGMILAGASPLKAVLIQIIVGYMLTAAVTVAGIVAAQLAIRQMFTTHHQLKL